MPNSPVNLKMRAHQAMLDNGFAPDFSPQILQAATLPVNPKANPAAVDLRHLLWSSIDNDSSRDLDQVEFAETLPDGTIRLLVGIADVDERVPRGSALDQHAAAEVTSVYTAVAIFPMLPPELSNDQTSLLGGAERNGLVIELRIAQTGEVVCHDVFPALLCNHAKVAYESIGAWLEGRGPLPAAVANTAGLEAQLRLQLEVAKKLIAIRKANGSLAFANVEANAVVENGEVKDLTLARHNVAEDLIESFMVAANVAMAQYLKEAGAISIQRVVKTPRRWDRIQCVAAEHNVKLPNVPDARALASFLEAQKAADPDRFPDLSLAIIKMLGSGEYVVERPGGTHEGHFGLAVQDYTHSTAPNRRYPDLVIQRILKGTLPGNSAPYTESELNEIVAHCNERESASRKVERLMRKIIAAHLLAQRIGQTFDGMITGVGEKGTFVRLLNFPAEGMVTHGMTGLDVGDRVQAKLVSVNESRGFIDFAVTRAAAGRG